MTNNLQQLRNKEVEKVYKNIVSSSSANMRYVSRDVVLEIIMQHPAPRFYITPKMAERYVLGYKRQLPSIINSSKLPMIEDLVSVNDKAVIRYKNQSRTMIWEHVVKSQAKSFYMTKKRIEEIIYKWRNGNK
jgi:hypothetical protein